MIKLSVKKRVAILLTCLWILYITIESSKEFHFPWDMFLSLGIFPIVIIWGIYWVISGFKRDKPKSNPSHTTIQNEKPELQNQEEHEKPKFQNREEYERWKAEKIRTLEGKQNQDNYDKSRYKDCPNCNKLLGIADGICQCGYNFNEPNLDIIRSIKRKRKFNNRIWGLGMILIGTLYLIIRWPDISNIDSNKHKFVYGIPTLLIMFGIYKLISGVALKSPTKSVFDNILGDKNAKDVTDDLEFIYCPSCRKQLFKEMQYQDCPHCGFKLSSSKKIKKIIWLTSSCVVIGILIYFAIQIFFVANESLHLAATQGSLNSISVLIKKGKDVNQSTSKGFTPLHAATIGGHEEAIKLLLDNGAFIDPREKEENRTPLHIATQNCNKRIVELLISRGADINARAIDNITPLHMAVIISNEEIVELLLKNGADTTILAKIRNSQYSPLQLAEIMPNENIVKLLKKESINNK